MGSPIYTFKVKKIDGQEVTLEEFQNKVLLIVNTASECGFTNQYAELQELYKEFSPKLEILGFPCNQFGAQEPGDETEIKDFCETNYQVTFPLFSKVDVNGENAHPLFQYLCEELPGLLGSKKVKWNFTKFLVDAEGNPIKRFAPQDRPSKIKGDIAQLIES